MKICIRPVCASGALRAAVAVAVAAIAACGGDDPATTEVDAGTSTCALTDNTTETAQGLAACKILTRDTSSCEASRVAAGLSGFWLKFSCNVDLSIVTVSGATYVAVSADGQPDYTSNYFGSSHACYEAYTPASPNPNTIAVQDLTMNIPMNPNTTGVLLPGGTVGLALNGVSIFDNAAGPGDDIYEEAETFDECAGHPQMSGVYHYHSEPPSITYDDSNFVGVLRDGYPIYGRRDSGDTIPDLDEDGGHTGTTIDSPTTAVYHYHINEQTSTSAGTLGEKQWFITTGQSRGALGSCPNC